MCNVTLIIPSLSSGGAERALATMANYWGKKGWQVTLLTLDDGRQPPFYELHPAVVHRPLNIAAISTSLVQGIRNNLYRLWVVRSAIKATRPDIIISFTDQLNVLTMLATRGLGIPVIVAERIDPHHQPIGKIRELLRRWLYPWAHSVIVQTTAALRYFSKHVQQTGRVIPNPVALPSGLPSTLGRADGGGMQKTIIAMGRLTEQKGIDLLLRAFALIARKHPQWSLEIWGDGPLRAHLEALCVELGLGGRVRLPGRTTEPFAKMHQADLFVLASRYEGFPNVLLEAMACGLPAISFDCASGPREIIRDGVDGILVPAGDVDGLAAAMDRLMNDEMERQRLAAHASDVLVRFNIEKIMGTWENLIQEVVKCA